MFPKGLKYSKEHEWIKTQGDSLTIGITDYAQKELGDIVFVELPELGRELQIGEAFGVVESVKAVSDIYAPCSGRVKAVNDVLLENPELLNQDPYGDGWMIEVEFQEITGELLSEEEYEEMVAEGDK